MRIINRHPLQVAASYLFSAHMATGTLGAGQTIPPAASGEASGGQSSSGWKRVGEMQTPDQSSNYPQYPSNGNGSTEGYPAAQAPYPNQGSAPNEAPPSYPTEGPAPQPGYQPGYGQAPYSQPGY